MGSSTRNENDLREIGLWTWSAISKGMAKQPVAVSVAQVRLEGGEAHVVDQAPQTIRLAAGQVLRILVHYRIEESSHGAEEFHVTLRSRLGDQRPDDVHKDKKDRPVLNDSEWGNLHQDFAPLTAGTHELFFDVQGAYGTHAWRGEGAEERQQAELARSIDVIVE